MSRLIDADALYKRIPTYVCVPCAFSEEIEEIEKDCKDCVVQRVMNIVDNFPTIDAVEVVRCRDCKWWDRKENSNYGYCHACKHGHYSEHWEIQIYRTYKCDWFCADGERKNENE